MSATYLDDLVVDLKASFLVRWTLLHNLGHKDPFIQSAVIVVLWNKLQLLTGE